MYNLRKAEPGHPVLQDFVKNLPYKPYSSDDLSFGLKISNAERALKRSYIQQNPRNMVCCITIDMDREDAIFAAYDANIVEPTLSVINKYKNIGRGHLDFFLKVPVCISENANRHPIQYLAAIQSALIKKLGGDPGYVGLVTKNPLNSDYDCWIGEGKSYTLDELAECLDLEPVKTKWRKKKKEEGLGHLSRNCDVFDDLRFWAYDRVSDARDSHSYSAWFDCVAAEAENLNKHQVPMLDHRELKAIVKSVAHWTWDKYTGQGSGCKRGRDTLTNSLLDNDKDKQILSAHETNKQRKKDTDDAISRAITHLKEKGIKITQKSLAQSANLGIATIKRKWKAIKPTTLGNAGKVSYGVHQDNSAVGEAPDLVKDKEVKDKEVKDKEVKDKEVKDKEVKDKKSLLLDRIYLKCSELTSLQSSKAYKKVVLSVVKQCASQNPFSFDVINPYAYNTLVRNNVLSKLKKVIYPMRTFDRELITVPNIEKLTGFYFNEFKEFWHTIEVSLNGPSDAMSCVIINLNKRFPSASVDEFDSILEYEMLIVLDERIKEMIQYSIKRKGLPKGFKKEDITHVSIAAGGFYPIIEIKPLLDKINLNDYF